MRRDRVGEAVDALAAEHDGGQDLPPGAIEFLVADRLRGELLDLGEDHLLGLLAVLALEQFDAHREPAGIAARVVAGIDTRRDPFVLDQLSVEPRRAAVAEDVL